MQQILSAIFGIVLLRILNAEDYGIVGMLAVFNGIASSIQEGGFTAALINRKNFQYNDYNSVFWFCSLLSVIMYLLLFLLAPLISNFYNNPIFTDLSRFLFVGFLFSGLGVAHNALLIKKMMVKERAMVDIISLFVSGVIGIVLALNGFAYWALAIQTVLYAMLSSVLKYFYSKWFPEFKFNFKPIKEMIGFGFKLFLSGIIWQITNNIFSVILGKFYGAKMVGYYSQGNKWMNMGSSVITGMVNSVAQPVLVEVNDDVERQKKVFRKMLRFGAFVSFPLMFCLLFVAKEFLYIVGGEKWYPAAVFLQLWCVWGAFGFLWNLYINIVMALGKSGIYMSIMSIVSLLQLLFVYFLFPYGIKIMLIFYIGSNFAGILMWHNSVKKILNISIIEVVKDLSPFLLATLFSIFISWVISMNVDNVYFIFVLKLILFSIVYILVMWLSNAVIFNEFLCFIFKKKLI